MYMCVSFNAVLYPNLLCHVYERIMLFLAVRLRHGAVVNPSLSLLSCFVVNLALLIVRVRPLSFWPRLSLTIMNLSFPPVIVWRRYVLSGVQCTQTEAKQMSIPLSCPVGEYTIVGGQCTHPGNNEKPTFVERATCPDGFDW